MIHETRSGDLEVLNLIDDLHDRLLWNEPTVKRLDHRPVHTGDSFRLWCGCKVKDLQPMKLEPISDGWPEIVLRAHPHVNGWVWLGRCPDCDLIVFYTERGVR